MLSLRKREKGRWRGERRENADICLKEHLVGWVVLHGRHQDHKHKLNQFQHLAAENWGRKYSIRTYGHLCSQYLLLVYKICIIYTCLPSMSHFLPRSLIVGSVSNYQGKLLQTLSFLLNTASSCFIHCCTPQPFSLALCFYPLSNRRAIKTSYIVNLL